MSNHKKKARLLNKNKHLTQDERISIETMLGNGASPYTISKQLGKSASTITREIQKHTKVTPAIHTCEFFWNCRRKRVCRKYCSKLCRECKIQDCTKKCEDYSPNVCEQVQKSPYVCNGCPDIQRCQMEKRLYRAGDAQKHYEAQLKDKRVGFDLTMEELQYIDSIVSPLIKAGHSPYEIVQTRKDTMPCSAATLYRLIDCCYLEARNIDLQEVVKRKPRKHTKITNKDAYARIAKAKQGHLWSDYLEYKKNHAVDVVQMDCVEGKKEEEAAILSLHWVVEHMQLYFIMDKQDTEHVIEILDMLEYSLGLELFQDSFPIIVTDNGKEFSDVEGMEASCTVEGAKRTKVFFCEPNRSDEKGHCERNHRILRKIVPKGTSLEPLRQADMLLITNHVNSYARGALGWNCPYDIAFDTLEDDFFVLLGLEKIESDQVVLTPHLLKNTG